MESQESEEGTSSFLPQEQRASSAEEAAAERFFQEEEHIEEKNDKVFRRSYEESHRTLLTDLKRPETYRGAKSSRVRVPGPGAYDAVLSCRGSHNIDDGRPSQNTSLSSGQPKYTIASLHPKQTSYIRRALDDSMSPGPVYALPSTLGQGPSWKLPQEARFKSPNKDRGGGGSYDLRGITATGAHSLPSHRFGSQEAHAGHVDRGPGPADYSPRLPSASLSSAHYTMRLSLRDSMQRTMLANQVPGPGAYATRQDRKGGMGLGSGPQCKFGSADKSPRAEVDLRRVAYLSQKHSRENSGVHSPGAIYSPGPYAALHSPKYSWGTSPRPCLIVQN